MPQITSQVAKAKGSSEDHETLGDNVKPSRYTILFEPNLKTFRFKGREIIEVDVKSRTDEIQLNAADLAIKSAIVVSNGSEQRAEVTMNADKQTMLLKLENGVVGPAEIKIEFSGVNRDGLVGFYRSSYTDQGQKRHLLTTQFEASDARRAFPCIDEPEAKATFNLSLRVDSGLDCVSNMPVVSTVQIGENKKEVSFMETPRMSTYLLYMGVGDLERISDSHRDVDIGVVTVPGKKEMGAIAIDYAKRLLEFYEGYFDINYPLPKLDLIAIPDFGCGAMENWGAITFREAKLLAGENPSLSTKQTIALYMAHELAHQWFGNLVTMKWWGGLWLNESFAEFMSYKALRSVFPEWRTDLIYLTDITATAFIADSLKSTHPMNVRVRTPAEADENFDEVTYSKGGAVLRMIEDYVGEERFMSGVRDYLKRHSYSNTSNDDLWRAIDGFAGRPSRISEIANYWANTSGYPIITAKRDGDGVELTQSRYFLLKGQRSGSVWPIPVTYSLSGDEKRILLDTKTAKITADRDDWLKLNFGQAGLYRVAYDSDDVARIGELIRSKRISGADSWGVEMDMFYKVRSGRGRAGEYLDFVEKYCINGDYPMNSNILGSLEWLNTMLGPAQKARLNDLIIRYGKGIMDTLGWEGRDGESTFDTIMRPAAIMSLGLAGHEPTVKKALSMFYGFVNEGKEIDPNLKDAVYHIAASNDGNRAFKILKEKFIKEEVPDEQVRLLMSMSSFSDKELLTRALDFAVSGSVRKQDKYRFIVAVSSNPVASEILWDWTRENWPRLMKLYPIGGMNGLNHFASALDVLSTERERDEIKDFFSNPENMRDDLKQAIAQTLERIDANINFAKANASP